MDLHYTGKGNNPIQDFQKGQEHFFLIDPPKKEQTCTIHSVSSRLFHVHNDIEDAAKWYKIPIALYDKNDVYIIQEDRCVFVGRPQQAIEFMDRNKGNHLKSRFPL
jgi:hypothetical protein